MKGLAADTYQALRAIFTRPGYGGLAGGVAVLALGLLVWSNNVPLLFQVLQSPLFTVSDMATLLVRLLLGITTSMGVGTVWLLVAMSILFGINVSLLAYSFNHRQLLPRVSGSGSSLIALVSGVFGAGCASCGTYLLGAALTFAGATGLLPLFPLGGREFLLVSIALLLVSVVWSARSLVAAGVCRVRVGV
ncbi:MAG: hypothetical protein HYZ62_02050 [Candidatus Andersenbacteria bacterium]|nr:hypothetical protein [Candidatus Andersenbacteria bacterium]